MTRLRNTLFPLLLALALSLLAGCKGASGTAGIAGTSPTPAANASLPAEAESWKTDYLGKHEDGAVFVRLVKVDRQIKGQMQYFSLQKNGETNAGSLSFDGVSDGENISITFPDKYLTIAPGKTITGTLKGDALTLFSPERDGTLSTLEFHSASVAEYNDAVRRLQEHGKVVVAAREEAARQAAVARVEAERIAAEKRAVVDAHRRVIDTVEELRGATQRLCGQGCYKSTLSAYATEWKQLQNEYATLKKEANPPLDSYRLNSVKYHLNGMKYHLNSHNYQRNSFESDVRTANDKVKVVNELINSLNARWERLQQAVAANTTGEPRSPTTSEQISQVVAFAQSEINKAEAARDTAQAKATAHDTQAADLYRQAEAFVKTLKPVDR